MDKTACLSIQTAGIKYTEISTYRKVVHVSETKSVVITSFKNGVWLHLQDMRKSKSASFSNEDFVNILVRMGKIQKSIKECEKQNKKKKNQTKSGE